MTYIISLVCAFKLVSGRGSISTRPSLWDKTTEGGRSGGFPCVSCIGTHNTKEYGFCPSSSQKLGTDFGHLGLKVGNVMYLK